MAYMAGFLPNRLVMKGNKIWPTNCPADWIPVRSVSALNVRGWGVVSTHATIAVLTSPCGNVFAIQDLGILPSHHLDEAFITDCTDFRNQNSGTQSRIQ